MRTAIGKSSAKFSYRVVCKRRYYEDEQLATEEEDIRFNTKMHEQAWPEVIAEQQSEKRRSGLSWDNENRQHNGNGRIP